LPNESSKVTRKARQKVESEFVVNKITRTINH
jgi:hypothetical protein